MNYFQIEFVYEGPYSNDGEGREANRALNKAKRTAEKLLKEQAFEYRLAYHWTDGSLYYYVRSPLSREDLRYRLNSVFTTDTGVCVERVYDSSPSEDPHKFGVDTLSAYFDKE